MVKSLVKNIIFLLVPLVIIIIAGIGLVNLGVITTEPQNNDTNTITITIIINYGNNDIETYTLSVSQATVYSALIQASEQYDFSVNATYNKQYQSYYITSINSFESGVDNKYWLYYLNDEMGLMAADAQNVKDNDVIKWSYE